MEQSSMRQGQISMPLRWIRFTGFHSLSQEMIERILRVREATSDIELYHRQIRASHPHAAANYDADSRRIDPVAHGPLCPGS